MKVVAISGWKGSGKDTIANHLVDTKDYIKFSFAGALKRSVVEKYNVQYVDLVARERKETALSHYPVAPTDSFSEAIVGLLRAEFKPDSTGTLCWTPRALAVLEGPVSRAVDPNHWVNKVVDQIDRFFILSNSKFVISDLRYKSEVSRLKEVYGDKLVTVRINRFNTVDTNDPSERDLDDYKDFDVIIDASKLSIAEVKELVDNIEEF